MAQPGNAKRRPWPAVARTRSTRLRGIERQLTTRLDDLYQSDRRGYEAILALLGRVLAHQTRRGQ